MHRQVSSSAQFGIDFEYQGAHTLLSLRGELDALSVPAFAGVLNTLVERGARSVTIELSELRFCDIGGLRAMAELAARLHAVDGSVEVLAPSILLRMLELSDLESLFHIEDSPARSCAPLIDGQLGPAARSGRPRADSPPRLSSGAA